MLMKVMNNNITRAILITITIIAMFSTQKLISSLSIPLPELFVSVKKPNFIRKHVISNSRWMTTRTKPTITLSILRIAKITTTTSTNTNDYRILNRNQMSIQQYNQNQNRQCHSSTQLYLYDQQQQQQLAFFNHPQRQLRHITTRSASTSTSTSSSTSAANTKISDIDIQYGINMNQEQMMESDKLIAVNEQDEIISSTSSDTSTSNNINVSKRDGHTFNINTPRGILHRAFSLFIFDKYNRLLLTKRSSTKITFPNVWTNTVCSHPLYNMFPNEVDFDVTTSITNAMITTANNNNNNNNNNNTVPTKTTIVLPGIKHAAIRKCYHELGIQSQYIIHSNIQFITRYHYWASDTITHGINSPWGEHEIDYLLFVQLNDIDYNNKSYKNSNNNDDKETELQNYDNYLSTIIQPNPEEVAEYKFVTQHELRTMLYNNNNNTTAASSDTTTNENTNNSNHHKLLWSPWFVGILERGGFDYWTTIQQSLNGFNTNTNITFFNPSKQHTAIYNLQSHTKLTGILQK